MPLFLRLSDVENRLSEITKKEGKNLDEFKGLLQEHASIQKEMEVGFYITCVLMCTVCVKTHIVS